MRFESQAGRVQGLDVESKPRDLGFRRAYGLTVGAESGGRRVYGRCVVYIRVRV